MKKYIIIILTLSNSVLNSQMPISNLYGHYVEKGGSCLTGNDNVGCTINAMNLSVTTPYQQNIINAFNKNTIITKKKSTNSRFSIYIYDRFTAGLSTLNPSNAILSSSIYFEPSSYSNIYNNGSGSFVTTNGMVIYQSSLSAGLLYGATSTYLNNCVTNGDITNISPYTSHLNLTRVNELNTNIKVFQNSANWHKPSASVTQSVWGAKYLKSFDYNVTDPINWSTYSGQDYQYDGNSLSTSVQTGVKTTSAANVCAGVYNPRVFLDMNSSIVDTLWNNVQPDRGIFQAYIYRNIGGTWTLVGSGKGNYTLFESSSYFIRYFYQLADDPATTSGVQYGYRDVYIDTKADALPSNSTNVYYPTNLIICKNENYTQSIKNYVLKPSAISFYNTKGDTLAWQIRLWQIGIGWANSTIYAKGNGNQTFDFSNLPVNPSGTLYVLTMWSSSSNICNHREYQRDIYVYNSTKPSIGVDKNFCNNEANFTIPNTPTGGTFNTVSGLTGNIFNPSSYSSTNINIPLIYTYTNSVGCVDKDTAYFNVYNSPKPSIGSDQAFCQFTSANYTIPNSPIGGTFKTLAGGSVPGLSGSSYNPTSAGIGANTVIYEVNNGNGCLHSDSAVYIVNANPKPSLGGSQSFCTNSSAYSIPNFPSGGTFNSITGLSGNVFTPIVAGIGTKVITYQVANGSCSNSDTISMSVFSSPPNILLSKDTILTCDNYGLIDLTANVISPVGVNWTGSGISSNKFNPTSVAVNNTYMGIGTLSLGVCSRIDTVYIVNRQGINLLNFTGISICSRDPNYNLNSLIVTSDKGGKHYSQLFPNRIVSDSILLTTNSIGSNNLKYYKIAPNGCSDTIDYTMVVNTNPASPSYIKNVDSVCTIIGNLPSNITLKSWYGIGVPNGINETWQGIGQSGGIVNIHALSPGTTYNFNYIQTDINNCKDTSIFRLKSNNGSNSVIGLTTTYDTICHTDGVLDLSNYNTNIKGGIWSYTTIPSAIQSNKNLSSGFLPINTIVTLNYTADTSGCLVTKGLNLIRYKPSTYAGIDKNLCSNGEPEILQGTPGGGVWSIDTVGTFVSVFNPGTLSITQSNLAKTYNLFYRVDNGGCYAYDTAAYTVIKKPNATFVKSMDSVCQTNGTLDMSVRYGVNPTNGIWLGQNLLANVLDLNAAGTGTKTHKYIIQNSYGCVDTTTYTTRIDGYSATGILDTSDYKVCEASAPIRLNQFKMSGSSGVWSGSSIIDTLFYPNTTGVGVFTVNYRTNNKSCFVNLSKKLNVVAKPTTPEIEGKLKYCKGDNFTVKVKSPNPILSYKWQYNSNFASTNAINGVINGAIPIKLIALNDLGCESFSKEFNLELDTPNSTGILASKTSILNGEEIEFNLEAPSSNINSYSWDFGDKTDKGSLGSMKHLFYNPSISMDVSYNVECLITSPTGCKKTLTKTITVLKRTTASIEDELTAISLYPNPTLDYIILKDNKFTKPVDVLISDIAGKVVLSAKTNGIESKIDLSSLSVGSYMVRYLKDSYKITIIEQ